MVISKDNTAHYSWGSGCDGWHLLKTENLSVISERMPPGTSERLHVHEYAQQLFYILKGNALFEAAGVKHLLQANQSIHVAPGLKHRISNAGETDLEFLVISEPPSHSDRTNI